MKQCPQCQELYLDDTLNFCLSDGAALAFSSNASEEETVAISSPFAYNTPQVIQQGVNPLFAYLAIGLLALIAGGAIVAWVKSDSSSSSAIKDENLTNRIAETNVKRNANVAQYSDPNTNNVSNASVNTIGTQQTSIPVDTSAYKSEVKANLDTWLQTVNNRDLDSHMRLYADRLTTYYKKSGVSWSFVRRENQNYFTKYSVLNMSISKLRIDVNSSTGHVVTTFDKTFNFRGDDAFLDGVVQSEFQWEKNSGVWKITSERDLQIYRVNKK